MRFFNEYVCVDELSRYVQLLDTETHSCESFVLSFSFVVDVFVCFFIFFFIIIIIIIIIFFWGGVGGGGGGEFANHILITNRIDSIKELWGEKTWIFLQRNTPIWQRKRLRLDGILCQCAKIDESY